MRHANGKTEIGAGHPASAADVEPAQSPDAPSVAPAPQDMPSRSLLNGHSETPDPCRSLLGTLAASKLYREYERAFIDAIGVPITLRTVESWQLPYHGKKGENTYCSFLAAKSRSCAACLRTTQRLSRLAASQPATVTCASGLSETAVPIRVGEQLVGFLQTGQVFTKPPTEALFERTASLLQQWDVDVKKPSLRDAFFKTRALTPAQHQSVVTMLTVFGQHLSMVGDQIAVWKVNSEPPVITRARNYIFEHQSEDLSLGQVAKAVNASSFYFCKLFRKSTGINFIDYLSQLRIEKAKNLLLNPNCLISEIAFEVGFQSLTHFNRVFKRMVGLSPSKYRAQLPAEG